MIRINLAGSERPESKSSGRVRQIGQKVTLAGTLILIVTSLMVGWRHRTIGQTESQLASDGNGARRDEAQLAAVLKQVSEFEARRTQLQQRATLIDEWRRGQLAPVQIIDQISRSLPSLTWLTEIKQDGYQVAIEGECTSLTALSDFVGNLEATHHFRRPVEIVVSEAASGQGAAPDLVRFTIRATLQAAGSRD